LRLRDNILKMGEILLKHPPTRTLEAKRIGGKRPHRASQSSELHARQVEMAKEPAAQRALSVIGKKIMTPEPNRNESIDVQIDHVGIVEQLHDLQLHAQALHPRRLLGVDQGLLFDVHRIPNVVLERVTPVRNAPTLLSKRAVQSTTRVVLSLVTFGGCDARLAQNG